MTNKELERVTQEVINEEANKLLDVLHSKDLGEFYSCKQLRDCQATVFETSKFIILRSYKTIVAFIYKPTGAFYDVHRTEYGYTATVAQHIAKFASDYRNEFLSEYRTYPV